MVDLAVLGSWLDLVTVEIFSNLNRSGLVYSNRRGIRV